MPNTVGQLLEIASAFARRGIDLDAVDDDLSAIAACALSGRCAGPDGQIGLLAASMEPFAVSSDDVGLDDLLVHRVLARWTGTPLLLCAIAEEAGRRAGLEVVLAGDGTQHALIHRRSPNLAWDPVTGVHRSSQLLEPRCGHEVSFAVLAQIVERATRSGDLSVALHATELRLRLPLAPPLRARVEAERAGLQASLN